jgi:LCP family protein required for cell wall assembly
MQPGSHTEPDPAPLAEPIGEEPPEGSAPRVRRRRTRKILLISGLVLVLLLGGGAAAVAVYVHSVDSSIPRVDAFGDVPLSSRPKKAETAVDAMNLLILGSDSRDPDNLDGSRSDTIILAHLPKDRSSAQLVSIPRDTWIHVPASKDGQYGNRTAKINAAYAWGGLPLTVQTVEAYTGVRIDHVVLVDFAGFQRIVDAIGGIDIAVDRTFKSIHPPYRTFVKGTEHMDGATALDYSRQRKQFPDGDFTRILHQQQVIKAILDKAASGGLLTDPGQLNAFLRAVASAVSVDNTLSLVDLAMNLRHLRSGDLTFFTSPSAGTGMVGSESVVFPDTANAKSLYDAIRLDSVPDILKAAH